jgi:hypothetical protein
MQKLKVSKSSLTFQGVIMQKLFYLPYLKVKILVSEGWAYIKLWTIFADKKRCQAKNVKKILDPIWATKFYNSATKFSCLCTVEQIILIVIY